MKSIAIVTGASRGIGLELVKRLVSKSISVWATSTKGTQSFDGCQWVTLDLTSVESISALSQMISEEGVQVKYLINNSGYLVNKPFAELTESDFVDCYGVNVLGVAQLIQKLMPHFSEDAHIVNIGSMGGVQGAQKFPGLSAYSSSKMALAGLTECLQEELGEKGWSFNYLALGAVQTEMLSQAFPDFVAPLSPEQMAEYISEFTLSGNTYIRGKILPVSRTTP
jgi:NAD(P)-dependent dehydrogenase (short-subunit alcohol dehydrogenase family)